jgi:hypothetical protein
MGHVSPCVALNHISYNWGHRFLYTYDELVAALERAGFKQIIPVSVGESYYDALAVVASDTEKTTATKRGYHLCGAVITDHGGYFQGQALVK